MQKSINTLVWPTAPVDVEKNTIRQIYQTKIVQLIEILQSRKESIRTINNLGISHQGKNNSHRTDFIEWEACGWAMLPAHRSARAPASTLYELVFPLIGSPTIMKPWRTSIISYTCQRQESHSSDGTKEVLCVMWMKVEVSLLHSDVAQPDLCTLLADQSLNKNQRTVMILWQFSLKQFKKLFSPGILPFCLLNVIPQLHQQHCTECEGTNQTPQITALNWKGLNWNQWLPMNLTKRDWNYSSEHLAYGQSHRGWFWTARVVTSSVTPQDPVKAQVKVKPPSSRPKQIFFIMLRLIFPILTS